VPSITICTRPDQRVFGKRLLEIGVGARPISLSALTERKLVDAIRATEDPAMIRAAASLGERVRTEDGVAEAVARIETLRR
jgi:UDP:flavonoid glycosyltransferase YjiC (YdhE family)